jgi:hypothetical protein
MAALLWAASIVGLGAVTGCDHRLQRQVAAGNTRGVVGNVSTQATGPCETVRPCANKDACIACLEEELPCTLKIDRTCEVVYSCSERRYATTSGFVPGIGHAVCIPPEVTARAKEVQAKSVDVGPRR